MRLKQALTPDHEMSQDHQTDVRGTAVYRVFVQNKWLALFTLQSRAHHRVLQNTGFKWIPPARFIQKPLAFLTLIHNVY